MTNNNTPAIDDDAPADSPSPARGRGRLIADVATAGSTVAPSWPITSFVAVNPLGSFTDRPFDQAVAAGRRWFGADGYLPLSTYRSLFHDGRITAGDLDAAIMRHDALFSSTWELHLGDSVVDALDVIRHDLVHGAEGSAAAAGPIGSPQIDRIVTTWCATYVDDDHVAWAMPDRDQGFFRAWRQVAGHDPALKSLAGRKVRSAVSTLPEDPFDAIAHALDHFGVAEADRVDQLRAWLLRTPGWASFARWCDGWAPADHAGVRLRAVDLIAVRASLEVLAPAVHRTSAPLAEASADPAFVAERIRTLSAEFGAPNGQSVDDLTAIVTMLTDDARRAIFLAAHEAHTRDEILTNIDRSAAASDDAGVADDDLVAQLVCCIDVRSEGLRRELESLGAYETFGFAGFFGVPVRWRPYGSDFGQARCPVLVTPQHEIAEQPIGDDADEFVRREAARLGLGEAKHAAKTGLGSPFAMAESMGWVTGPMAAAKTLLPARRPTRDRPESTEPMVKREDSGELNSGLSLEERTLFAEAIIATIGFRRFAPVVVLCGHGAATVNNPHGSSLDCGACGGAPGGASARIACEILNDAEVREALLARSIDVPAETRFVAGEHDTVSDTVTFFDVERLGAETQSHLSALATDLETAGAANARRRARYLSGDADRVRDRGGDWAEVRQEWGLARNAAFVIGPRSITADADLDGRVFLHSYDGDLDTEGKALETIMTAPLVVGQWISSQYHFSTTAPDVFGAGDKQLHNPVGGIGVMLGQSGDLAVGLPQQSVSNGDELFHEPVRLNAIVQAPIDRIEGIIQRNDGLRDLVENEWIRVVARPDAGERWAVRERGGVWATWWPADGDVADSAAVPQPSVMSQAVA